MVLKKKTRPRVTEAVKGLKLGKLVPTDHLA